MKKGAKIRQVILFVGDILLFATSLIIALIISFENNFTWKIYFAHFVPFSILFLAWLIFFEIFGLYELESLKSFWKTLWQIFGAMTASGLLAVIFFYLFPSFGIAPKTNLLIFVLIFSLLLLLWRIIFGKTLTKHFQKRIVIVGKSREVNNFISEIKKNPQLGYKFVKLLTKKDAKKLTGLIEKKEIDIIIFLHSDPKEIKKILYACLTSKIDIWDFATAYELIFKKIPLSCVDYQWFFQNLKEGQKILFDKTKRVLDIVLACLFLITFSPFFLAIPIFIKLEDRGPVLYKQKRIGKDLKIFWLYKFRSMKPNAERNKAVWATPHDSRITKIGKALRFLHFDEFPQMINILKGEISFVGPRPERPEFVKKLEKDIPFYDLRHIIKPGFTGWAQVKFRYARSISDSFEKFQYDLFYIKNRSFVLDFLVLIKTVRLLFRKG